MAEHADPLWLEDLRALVRPVAAFHMMLTGSLQALWNCDGEIGHLLDSASSALSTRHERL
jgi:hypothetical protein